jgi:lysosomal acid lipase/cholesteryl ester hydrolase
MDHGGRLVRIFGVCALCLALVPGCATMRENAPSLDLRPCSDGFACTSDGWKLGIRHIRPATPDPSKLPVVLCHGLGLNATFWTITDNHLPAQLAARGYEVFLFDLRGSGNSSRVGKIGEIDACLRQTFCHEIGEGKWNVDQIAFNDLPAVLDYVKRATGRDQVNWVGHSLGGMVIFPFLERSGQAARIANFIGMGSTIILANAPEKDMLRANRGLRVLGRVASTGRLGRPLMVARFPGMSRIDQFYFTASNVDRETVSRFYGYTLEDPGRSALRQLDPYLEFGHFLSADRSVDYSALLGSVTTPTLLVGGEGDIMSSIASTQLTLDALGSPDKSLASFGKSHGNVADYGHCDLVWSRYAPQEIFPTMIDWLDVRQPPAGNQSQAPTTARKSRRVPQVASAGSSGP